MAADQSNGFTGTGAFALNPPGSDPIVIVYGPLDHFDFNPITDRTAGQGFSVTATAKDEGGRTVTNYTDNVTLSEASAGTALHGSPAGCPGQDQPCTASYGSTNPVAAVAGVATWSDVTGYKAEGGRQLKADDGSLHTGLTDTFAITHDSIDHFAFNGVSDRTAGSGFPVSATAQDKFYNTVDDFTGNVTLSEASAGTALHGSPRGARGRARRARPPTGARIPWLRLPGWRPGMT